MFSINKYTEVMQFFLLFAYNLFFLLPHIFLGTITNKQEDHRQNIVYYSTD